VSSSLRDFIKLILNTDPKQRITLGEIRHHEWFAKIKPQDLEGIVVGKDRIPIIQEIADQLKDHFTGENLAQADTFVQNNKHN
jgi:serine/threonine protein kinase